MVCNLKQVAQQEAQRAQFYVERAKQEKQQKIVQADGEAQAAKLISFCRILNAIMRLIHNVYDLKSKEGLNTMF